MPWEVIRKGGQYCVRNIESGVNEKCYSEKKDAVTLQRAMYASIGEDKKSGKK